MMDQFDPTTHTFTIDGIRVPSITQILADAGLIDTRWHSDEPRNWGTVVALATELHDKGELVNEPKSPGVLAGYLAAWRRVRTDMGLTDQSLDAIEEPCYSHGWRFAGIPDRVVHLPGDDTKTIIEIKTGSKAPWHKLQTAAQMMLVAGATGRMCVYLKKNGRYSVDYHEEFRADHEAFVAVLHLWHWKEEHGYHDTGRGPACTDAEP